MEEVITCQRCGNPDWNSKNGTKKNCDDCKRIIKAQQTDDSHRKLAKMKFNTYRRS